jgi:hypothetical protein
LAFQKKGSIINIGCELLPPCQTQNIIFAMVYKFKKKFEMVKEKPCARFTTYNKKIHFNHLDRNHKDKKKTCHDYANLDRPCIVSNKKKVTRNA